MKTESGVIRFQTKSGELVVTRKDDLIVLDFPSRPPVETDVPDGLIEALGAKPEKVLKSRDYLAVYASQADVAALKPDFRAISALGVHAVIATAKGDDADFVSRFFAPGVGVDEDPVTGSAHCTLIPYWAEQLGKTQLFAAADIETRRRVVLRAGRRPREDRGPLAVLYLKGEIYLEAEQGESATA